MHRERIRHHDDNIKNMRLVIIKTRVSRGTEEELYGHQDRLLS